MWGSVDLVIDDNELGVFLGGGSRHGEKCGIRGSDEQRIRQASGASAGKRRQGRAKVYLSLAKVWQMFGKNRVWQNDSGLWLVGKLRILKYTHNFHPLFTLWVEQKPWRLFAHTSS